MLHHVAVPCAHLIYVPPHGDVSDSLVAQYSTKEES